MKPIQIISVAIVALAAAAALMLAPAAAADQPFDRCLDLPEVVPGPGACEFGPFTQGSFFPAGTRCAFDVTVSYELSGRIYYFDNPPRAVAHLVGVGTATGNGHTLIRTSHFTETASPEIVFTDHGLLARYHLPGGQTITVWAGYRQESIVPPKPELFHGNPPPGIDPGDTAAFCAALT